MEQQWFYGYDPDTFQYTGMITGDVKPENATASAIGNLMNPTYDPMTDTWVGEDIEDYLAKLQAEAEENASRPTAVEMVADLSAQFAKTTAQSLLTQATLAKQLATAMVQITTLQEQVAKLTPKEGE